MAETQMDEVHDLVEDIIRDGLQCLEYTDAILLTLRPLEEADSLLALLPILCCEAAGGEGSQAAPIAAAWLLLYMAAKMLDDVEDEELDTLSQTLSPAQAVNVATGLIFASQLASAHLHKRGVDSDLLFSLHEDFNRTALRICAGQHADLLKEDPSLEHCLQIMAAKSGEPFALACRAGASLGTENDKIALYSEFGYNLGVLIQIDNDFNGIWNPENRSDLAAGKRTLPIIYALSVAPSGLRRRLRGLLSRAVGEPQAEEEARRIITELGALQYMMVEAQIRRRRAKEALRSTGRPSPAHDKLIEILDLVMPV